MSASAQDPVVSAPGQGAVSDLAGPEGQGIQSAPWGGARGVGGCGRRPVVEEEDQAHPSPESLRSLSQCGRCAECDRADPGWFLPGVPGALPTAFCFQGVSFLI